MLEFVLLVVEEGNKGYSGQKHFSSATLTLSKCTPFQSLDETHQHQPNFIQQILCALYESKFC
jgi:hypothetical protein